jgi:hypothetical protein
MYAEAQVIGKSKRRGAAVGCENNRAGGKMPHFRQATAA